MWVVTCIQRARSFIYKYRYIYIHHPYILNTRVKYMYQSKRIVNKKWSSTTHSYISRYKHSSPYNSVPVLATTNSTWPMISVLTVSTENWIVPQCTIIRIHTRYTVQYTILYVNLQHMLHFVIVYYRSIPLMYTNDQATFILNTSDQRVTPSSRGDNPPVITTFQIQIKYLGNKWFKHTSLMYC